MVNSSADNIINIKSDTLYGHLVSVSNSFTNPYFISPWMNDLLNSLYPCLCLLLRMQGTTCLDTICITIEDYCQDFVHLRDRYYEMLLKKTQIRVAKEYYRALFAR